MTQKAIFRFGAHDNYSDVLHYELASLTKPGESRWYWIAAQFVIDNIIKKENGITLYYVRRPRQRKNRAIILQSDWKGMEYFQIQQVDY